MNKVIKIIPIIVTGTLLASCGNKGTTGDQTIKWISPIGAPTLAFASEVGRNKNYEAVSTPSLVGSELQMTRKDVVVFDALNGLKSVIKNKSTYKLTRLVTGGNICLAGIGKAEGSVPQSGDKVIAYGEGLIPDQVFAKLCSDYWNVDLDVTYVAGNADVIAALKGTEANYDWAIIAQPGIINVNASETKITTYTQLRNTWAAYTASLEGVEEQKFIPQAGAFVLESTLNKKKEGLTNWFKSTDLNIKSGLETVENVETIMNAYGDSEKQIEAFGYNCNMMKECQSNNKNEFGLVGKDEITDIAEYLKAFSKVLTGEEVDYTEYVNNFTY